MPNLKTIVKSLFHSNKPKLHRCPSCGGRGLLRDFVICFNCKEYVCSFCGDDDEDIGHFCGSCLEHGSWL
jgi:predicted RNA-binding Zn-ribbon protein involved in translation (DUF1610 family)